MTTFEMLKNEKHARYTVKYDFLRAYFVNSPKQSEILSYLIGMEDMHGAAGEFFEANKQYVATGVSCALKTVERAYAEFERLNLIKTQPAKVKGKGTMVMINQDGINALYELVMSNDIYGHHV